MPLSNRKAVLLAGLVAMLTMLAPSLAPAAFAFQPANNQCRVVGAISHRCYAFHSDATWREGLPDYHGENGG